MTNLTLLSSLKVVVKSLRLGVMSAVVTGSLITSGVSAEELGYAEKEELKFGFIKLTDMVPLAIAYEKGYFEDEGLYSTG